MNSFDGVHRRLVPISVAGEQVEWRRIEWKTLARRQFVEIEIWEEPKTEGELSPLRWLVYEVKGVGLHPVLDKVIRRRKRLEGKQKFEMDKARPYRLYAEKGQIHWKVDFESGVIK